MRILILLAIVWSSCRATRPPEPISQEEKDEILFVVFRISKDSIQKKNVIGLVSQKKTEGKIKDQDESAVNAENYLTIEYYRENKLVKTIVMEHPLHKRVEYSENNVLMSKSINLASEEFFIRLQVKGNANSIRVSETFKGSTKKELTTLNL